MMIEKRKFGNTGHKSSAVIFGAAALWNETQSTADRVLDLLLKYGVNHIDVAHIYGDAELRIGPWMNNHRKDFFLATKTYERTYSGAKESIMHSLDRLRTDHIDLMQMHGLTNPIEWDQAMGENGALEAIIDARAEGLVKFIGVTGHGWTVAAMHQKSLMRYNFDSILLPWNWFMSNYRNYPRDFYDTLKLCKNRNIAVQTIKAIARGPYAAGMKKNYTPWYQPLDDQYSIQKSIDWVLSFEDIFLNSLGDVNILPIVLQAASSLGERPSDKEMIEMEKKAGLTSIFGA
jgi:aryl-alcohol dehydrogenase-like predicted oxidoreductase